jgi:two-component system chemotaxis sensor kinase CheA
MDKYADSYKEEARELLAELESALLDLEQHPENQELVARAFRSMHTIKSSGAMFGFDAVSAFTHELENVFDRICSGTIPVGSTVVGLALRSKDHIAVLLDDPGAADSTEHTELVKALKALTADPTRIYRIRFRPLKDVFRSGTDPLALIEELRALGACQAVVQANQVPPLEEMDPESPATYWDLILTTDKGVNAIEEVFVGVKDESDISIEEVDDGKVEGCSDYMRLGEILIERGDVTLEQLMEALLSQSRVGEILATKGAVAPGKIASALAEQQAVRTARQVREQNERIASLRVAASKVDTLIDLIGKLVMVQARLTQTAMMLREPELSSIAEEVGRLTAELQDNTLNLRMSPIGTTFDRFRRLVRDLSVELGKEVDLVMEGAEIELDKTVIERLNDPLVHLIRNSIDHGIEPPDLREKAGKPKRGTVHFSTSHTGANLLIRITDDGRGLDPEAIRAKAVERRLVSLDAKLSEMEIYDFIFASGLSTAKTISQVSGRGVGMDAVKHSIESLRGTVEIHSTKGQGTTVTIRLPMTLAIMARSRVGGQGAGWKD